MLRRDIGGVDVEAGRVVPGVLGDAAGVEGEEVGDRLGLDVHSDGVDQDESGDESRGVPYGHLGGGPAAERGADDQYVAQLRVVEEVQVGEGEIVDAGEPVRGGGSRPIRGARA